MNNRKIKEIIEEKEEKMLSIAKCDLEKEKNLILVASLALNHLRLCIYLLNILKWSKGFIF